MTLTPVLTLHQPTFFIPEPVNFIRSSRSRVRRPPGELDRARQTRHLNLDTYKHTRRDHPDETDVSVRHEKGLLQWHLQMPPAIKNDELEQVRAIKYSWWQIKGNIAIMSKTLGKGRILQQAIFRLSQRDNCIHAEGNSSISRCKCTHHDSGCCLSILQYNDLLIHTPYHFIRLRQYYTLTVMITYKEYPFHKVICIC